MREIHWRRTPGGKAECVEIGRLAWGHFAIRNAAFRSDKALFTAEELEDFIIAVKMGHFDDMIWRKIR